MQYYITPLLWVDDEIERSPTVFDAIDSMKLGVRVYVRTSAQAKAVLMELGVPRDHVEQQIEYCMTGHFEGSTLEV